MIKAPSFRTWGAKPTPDEASGPQQQHDRDAQTRRYDASPRNTIDRSEDGDIGYAHWSSPRLRHLVPATKTAHIGEKIAI